jgi:4-hydroxy-2-oxoheptanedioate aldolase
MVEVIGHTQVIDYVEFSGEYAPYDLYALENFGRAVDLFDHMSSMMKIEQEPRTYLAARANGSGIQNLLFADIRNVGDARESIGAARAETPKTKGVAGAAMRRDVGYVLGPGSVDYVQALEEGVVAFMIEKQAAIDNLEEILALKGLDMVQFGPADYSMSIGIPGRWEDPRVKEAEKYVIETALQVGIRPRAEINDFELSKPYIDMGVKDFCIGWDVLMVYDYCKKQGEGLARLLGL